jgi:hypothetical protein
LRGLLKRAQVICRSGFVARKQDTLHCVGSQAQSQ